MDLTRRSALVSVLVAPFVPYASWSSPSKATPGWPGDEELRVVLLDGDMNEVAPARFTHNGPCWLRWPQDLENTSVIKHWGVELPEDIQHLLGEKYYIGPDYMHNVRLCDNDVSLHWDYKILTLTMD